MARLPSVRQLQYFVALEETEHFGRAALACNVSQSAFSNAIREFETTLELQLVERNNRRVIITATGRTIAQQARHCLAELERLAAMARESVSPLSGKLTLGVIPTIAPFLLPEMMPGLRREFPQLQLFLREQRSEALYRDLLGGHVDLLLMALPYPMQRVETQALFEGHCLVFHATGYLCGRVPCMAAGAESHVLGFLLKSPHFGDTGNRRIATFDEIDLELEGQKRVEGQHFRHCILLIFSQ